MRPNIELALMLNDDGKHSIEQRQWWKKHDLRTNTRETIIETF